MSLIAAGTPSVTDAPLIAWSTLVTTANVAADEADADYPVTNLANPSTALKWAGTTVADQYVTITLTGSQTVDYLAIARHNFGTGGITASVEVSDGLSPEGWTEVGAETSPTTDAPIMWTFTDQTPPKIRIKMQPASVVPEMAVVFTGNLLRMPHGIANGFVPLTWATQDDVIAAESQAGDYLGQVVRRQALAMNVDFEWIDYDWAITNMTDFFAYARQQKPFFFCWAPSSYAAEIGYAWAQNDIRPRAKKYQGGIAVDINFDLRAVTL